MPFYNIFGAANAFLMMGNLQQNVKLNALQRYMVGSDHLRVTHQCQLNMLS